MDDDRLIVRLRGVDASADPSPQFVDELHDVLAERLGFPVAEPAARSGPRPVPAYRPPRPWRSTLVRRGALLVVAALLVLGALANAAAIGSLIDRIVHRPGVLDEIRGTGTVSVAVTADAPQVRPPAGGLDGFDLDVAQALARRLGVRAEISVTSAAEVLRAPGDRWQAAMPGIGIDPSATSVVLMTRPYYRWPVYLLGPAGQEAGVGLDGAVICVVAGSAGAAWLEGAATGPAITVRAPAPNAVPDPEADESTCMSRVKAGEAAAMVTSTLLPSDIATADTLRLLVDGPVAIEPRAVAVPAGLRGSAELRDALDQAIADLEADGTLADLARSRFGTDSVVIGP